MTMGAASRSVPSLMLQSRTAMPVLAVHFMLSGIAPSFNLFLAGLAVSEHVQIKRMPSLSAGTFAISG